MPTITAQMILTRAATKLFDEDGVRWTPGELLQDLSDAQREVCVLKPTAYTINAVKALETGTRQMLPDDSNGMVSVVRNIGGRAVTQIHRTALDASRPNWHSETPVAQIKHYVYDDRDAGHFYVYPPSDGAGQVELIHPAVPPEITDVNAVISLPDSYEPALYYLVMARALTKDSGTANFGKAQAYHSLAVSLITGQAQAKQRLHPEQLQERTKR